MHRCYGLAWQLHSEARGQVMYGTFLGSGMLRAGSDWGTEAAVLE